MRREIAIRARVVLVFGRSRGADWRRHVGVAGDVVVAAPAKPQKHVLAGLVSGHGAHAVEDAAAVDKATVRGRESFWSRIIFIQRVTCLRIIALVIA